MSDPRLLSEAALQELRTRGFFSTRLAIAHIDALAERNAKLERALTDIVKFGGEDFGRQPLDNAHHLAFVKDIALAALEVTE